MNEVSRSPDEVGRSLDEVGQSLNEVRFDRTIPTEIDLKSVVFGLLLMKVRSNLILSELEVSFDLYF